MATSYLWLKLELSFGQNLMTLRQLWTSNDSSCDASEITQSKKIKSLENFQNFIIIFKSISNLNFISSHQFEVQTFLLYFPFFHPYVYTKFSTTLHYEKSIFVFTVNKNSKSMAEFFWEIFYEKRTSAQAFSLFFLSHSPRRSFHHSLFNPHVNPLRGKKV